MGNEAIPTPPSTAAVKGESDFWISVVIPLRDSRKSIGKALDGLHHQKLAGRCELILVCDLIHDDTLELIHNHPLAKDWSVVEITKPGRGLAEGYNLGWKAARAPQVLFMHSDCYPIADDAMLQMCETLRRESAVAVKPLVATPDGDWETMSFWDRVTSARFYPARPEHNLLGKFDLFDRAALEKIDGFDQQRFLSSTEDADITVRLLAIGKIVAADVVVIHAHLHPPEAKFKAVLRKQGQTGEGFGALVRKHGLVFAFTGGMLPVTAINLLKLVLPIAVFIPPVSLYAAILLALLSLYYVRWAVFTADWRVVVLPVAIPLIFLAYGVATIRGYCRGRQAFDYVNYTAKSEPGPRPAQKT